MKFWICSAMAVVLIPFLSAQATETFLAVDGSSKEAAGDGSVAKPFTTIKAAIDAAKAGDTGKATLAAYGLWLKDGQFSAVDGTIIAIDAGGQLVMVEMNPTVYKELGRLKPEPPLNCCVAPVIADKKLFVRSPAELICYDLK